MKEKFSAYFAAVKYLEDLARLPIAHDYLRRGAENPKIFLERTRYLLKLLGGPHRGFKYVHITGTAGKGTTTALLHNMLYLSGQRVGSFYSPFCTTSIEKIKVNDKLISPADFALLLKKLKPAIEAMKNSGLGRPSYFECFLALALLYFKKMRCRWVVLEAGLGGSFDATNVIARPQVSAITNIGLDHTQILGRTLAKIASDKAGVIKRRTNFFTTETRPRLLEIFAARCRRLRAKFHLINAPGDAKYRVSTEQSTESYQEKNNLLAAAIARHLRINNAIIARAMAITKLPCRFEITQTKPLVILDGAHNPLKIKNVIHNLKNLTYAKLYIIFACAANKDARQMIKSLSPLGAEIIFTQFYSDREAYKADKLACFVKNHRRRKIINNPQDALRQTLNKMSKKDALLVTGSFYLAGELRKRWVPEKVILAKRTV